MKYKKLGDIFLEIRNGANIKQSSDKTGKPITRIETIVDNKIDLKRVGFANILNDDYKNFYLNNGDILMSHINSVSHLGKVAIVENIDDDIIHGMNLLILKNNRHEVFPKYSYFYFCTERFKKQLIPITKKSVNQASFNISDLKEIQIPLPSYENQIRTAKLLEKIEITIAERKNVINLLDELAKATFYQMFGDYKSISKSKLKILGDNISYLTSGSRGWAKYYSENGAKFLRIQNVGNGVIREDNLVYVNPLNSAEAKRTKVQTGDLIISITADLGRSSVVPPDFGDAYINQHLALIRLNENINPKYAAWFFNMPFGNNAIRKKNRAAVKAGLNFDDINSFPILIPPIDRQNKFADVVQQIETIKVKQEAQLKVLEELYASVSQKVFAGDIDLSKVPFDASLLPKTTMSIEIPKEGPIDKPDIILQQEVPKQEIKKENSKNDIKGLRFGFQAVRHLGSWEDYSFKEIADNVIKHFRLHYFNVEMILDFLDKELDMQVNYYSSSEQKKNPQYENADDFFKFLSGALSDENPFLRLEQVFYNAETENIPNISFTKTDLEKLSKKDKKERSGIYFHIKDETTTT